MQKESKINMLGVWTRENELNAKIPTSNHFYFMKLYSYLRVS